MTAAARHNALAAAGLLHPNPRAVTAALFSGDTGFFLIDDKVQVKYEMLRAHLVDGLSVTASAASHGYSRAAFYLVAGAYAETGMAGLIDERRGRRGPVKLTDDIVEFIAAADQALSGAELADEITVRFGVVLHRRTVERARWR